MKSFLQIFLYICIPVFTLKAQMPANGSLEFTTGPVFNGRIIKALAVPADDPSNLSQFSDSLKNADRLRMGLNYGIYYVKAIRKNKAFRVGLSISDYGFRRVRNNIGFGDLIHPEVGLVADNSQIGPRDVHYDVRYRYMEIPMTYIWNSGYRHPLRELEIQYTAGFAPAFLLQHETVVRLRGFTTSDGVFTYHVPKTGYNASGFNLMMLGGIRFDYAADKRMHLLFAPNIRLPLIPGSSGPNERHHLFQIGAEAGVVIRLGDIPGAKPQN